MEKEETFLEQIVRELLEQQNIRSNLSTLRQMIKEEQQKKELKRMIIGKESRFIAFLKNEDAKTRKNAALLLGDLACQPAAEALYEAYQNEQTLFVRASYLQALAELDVTNLLPDFRDALDDLLETEPEAENKKHFEEEIRALRKILIRYEGITEHTPQLKDKEVSVILLTNRTQRENVRRMIDCGEAAIHPLGVLVKTKELPKLLNLRPYKEILFPILEQGFFPAEPVQAAAKLWDAGILTLLNHLHKEQGSFYFRIECKSSMDLEARSAFTRKMASELEMLSKGELINSTSDYEVEIRLIANKEGEFFPAVKLSTIKDKRFTYRKNHIPASIQPSTAALIMEAAKEYLKKDAQIMDPFCGVGTMLIERHKCVPAKTMYATDIYGDAIVFARENTELAGLTINYIHRDFMDFKHEYLFDEIVTNMPLRGKKTKQEMDAFYHAFFVKAKEILKKEAVMILYTNEIGFVKKQLRLHKEYTLLQETCMQPKNDFYLLVIGYKG